MSASAGGSGAKSKSSSRSPFEKQAMQLFGATVPKLQGEPAPYAGVPSEFENQGPDDILAYFLGGGQESSPLTGTGQTVKGLLETGLPADTTGTETALNEVRRRTLGEESANLQERSGIAGTRFSTGYLNQEGELSRKSLEDYMATVAPLRYGAAEAASGRRAGATQQLLQAALTQRGLRQRTQETALGDQRARELGYLPYIVQLLSSIGPSSKSKAESYSAQAGGGK